MTELPVITVSPHGRGWRAICSTCAWAIWATKRPVVDLEAEMHQGKCVRRKA